VQQATRLILIGYLIGVIMDRSDILDDGEEVLCTANAYENDTSLESGTLVCTDDSVIFSSDRDITHIDVRRIDAFEFSEPEYPLKFLWGAILASIGVLLWVVSSNWQGDIPSFLPDLGLVITVIGFVILIVGILFRRATLKLHTGATSFEFTSRDSSLREFPSNLE